MSKETYEDFFNSRPPRVQEFLRRRSPQKLWKVKGTGQIVQIESIDEPKDGTECTCTVFVPSMLPPLLSRTVFGYKANDLEEVSEEEIKQHPWWGQKGLEQKDEET